MLWIFVTIALVAVTAVAILWPFLRNNRTPQPTVDVDPRLLELYSQRDRLYQATRDARFDMEMGKLTDEDYAAHTGQLKQQAAVVLRSIDETEAEILSPALDATLEAEIARQRTQPRTNGRNGHAASEDALEAAIASARRSKTAGAKVDRYCGRCGTLVKAGDRFCGSCGQGVGD
ncbi:MAG: hypothetical protein J5I90_07525 [Caldilineales bacterium]|nr:hypothetical protein [Caldilineales bacterium]